MRENYVRFDWAMKRLLRDKANFAVIEGLLTTLLGRKTKINRLLESEGNQLNEADKFNRVDILAENDLGELMIVEIQNSHELDYFHRMLYGVSKAITEYIKLGDDYRNIKKVYSINILYFDFVFKKGNDYVFFGENEFVGLHNNEPLLLSPKQRKALVKEGGEGIPTENFILRVGNFNKVPETPLDEWIEFLKNGEINEKTSTPGLCEAREILRIDMLSEKQKREYYNSMEALRYQRSVISSSYIKGKDEGVVEGEAKGFVKGKAEGLAEGLAEGSKKSKIEIAKKMKKKGLPEDVILEYTGININEII